MEAFGLNFHNKLYILGTHQDHLAKALLMGRHNNCFYGDIWKISFLLSFDLIYSSVSPVNAIKVMLSRSVNLLILILLKKPTDLDLHCLLLSM